MNPHLTDGMEKLPWPSSKPRSVPPGPKFSERMRRAAWLGLYGCAHNIVHARTDSEKKKAEGRIVEYLERLKALGVEPPKEEA